MSQSDGRCSLGLAGARFAAFVAITAGTLTIGAVTTAAMAEPLRLEALSATLQRPLFAPGRRPPPPPQSSRDLPPAAPVETQTTPPHAVLVGIVQGEAQTIAVFDMDGRTVTLSGEETLEGWRLTEANQRAIVLMQDGQRLDMQLAEPGEDLGESQEEDRRAAQGKPRNGAGNIK